MRKFLFVLIAVTILFAFGVSEWLSRAGYGSQSSAQADVPPPVSARQLSNEEAVPAQGQQTTKEENVFSIQVAQGGPIPSIQNSAEVSSADTKALLGEDVPSDPVMDSFRTLHTKFYKSYIQPGWLHFIYREEHPFGGNTGVMYNGEPLPNTYLQETWYRLDENRMVVEGVFLLKDEIGEIMQVTVFRDSAWHNLTTGETFPTDKAPSIQLDGHFAQKLETAYIEGGQLTQTETLFEGKSVVVFSYEKTFTPPLVLDNYPEPVQQVRGNAYVDPINGAVLVLERIFWNTRGQELVALRTLLIKIETNVNLPGEILKYLEEVK